MAKKNAFEIAHEVFWSLERQLAAIAAKNGDSELSWSLEELKGQMQKTHTSAEAWGVVSATNELALPVFGRELADEIDDLRVTYPKVSIDPVVTYVTTAMDETLSVAKRTKAARTGLVIVRRLAYLARKQKREQRAKARESHPKTRHQGGLGSFRQETAEEREERLTLERATRAKREAAAAARRAERAKASQAMRGSSQQMGPQHGWR